MLRAALLALLLALPAQAEDRPDTVRPPPESPQGALATRPAPPESLDELLESVTGSWLFRKARVGLHIVDVTSGEEVFNRGGDLAMNPASTMKVVTSATALKMLGPSYRFSTNVYMNAEAEIDPAGVLRGNVYVKGHGDPTFVVEKLWKMVLDLKLMGVKRVEGSVVFDDSFHSGGAQLPGWNKPADLKVGPTYFSTLSALSLDMNVAVLVVGPGAEVGAAARVNLETPSAGYVTVDNQTRTGALGSRSWIEVTRVIKEDGTRFVVRGSVPAGTRRATIRRTVADPAAHFASAFEKQMEAQGIKVTGRWRKGRTPADSKLLVHVPSLTLGSILMDMNKYSLNFQAEQILRTLGAEVEGEGSTEAGLRVVEAYLSSLGVPSEGSVLVNGSGLSREAKIAPSALTAVLMDMARDPQVGSEFMGSLAIGGVDGTLWKRLRDEPGRLRGKTGTIDGVHCLTGYLDSDNGRRYAFAFMTNYGSDTRASMVRQVHDSFARLIFKMGAEGAD